MTETLNLYQKLAAISGGLGAIEKDGNYDGGQRGGSYKFISHSQLMGHLRNELARHNVVIVAEVRESRTELREKHTEYNGQSRVSVERRVVVTMQFTVTDGDSPESSFTARWFGEGIDNGDKATQKAATSGEKYFLMKLFKVSDKDDPDAEREEVEARQAPATTTQRGPAAGNGRPPVPGGGELQTALMARIAEVYPDPEDRGVWLTAKGLPLTRSGLMALSDTAAESWLAVLAIPQAPTGGAASDPAPTSSAAVASQTQPLPTETPAQETEDSDPQDVAAGAPPASAGTPAGTEDREKLINALMHLDLSQRSAFTERSGITNFSATFLRDPKRVSDAKVKRALALADEIVAPSLAGIEF